MTSIQILKQKQELEKKVDQLADLSINLLSENRRRSDEIEKLTLQQVGTNNKILDIYLLLCSEIRKNVFLKTDSKTANDMLNNMFVLVKVLLHKNESSERENETLRKIIRKLKKGSIEGG